jgi:hypothetical protein
LLPFARAIGNLLMLARIPRVFRSIAIISALIVIAHSFAGCTSSAPRDGKVGVHFIVTAPATTPAADTLYISGSDPDVGNWNGKGLALKRQSNGEHEGTVRLTKGSTLEYKITRGSWDTVEKAADGSEIANRTISLDRDQTVRLAVANWSVGATTKPKEHTATGDIRYHKDFRSKILGNTRELIVWLPPGYEKDKAARYAVLYMHDGQNLFDDFTSFAGEWHADETARRLIEEGKIVPIIIVGIENAAKRASMSTRIPRSRFTCRTRRTSTPARRKRKTSRPRAATARSIASS